LAGHRFCGTVNRQLDMEFAREDNVISDLKGNKTRYFPYYLYEVPECGNYHRLYQLKFESEPLLPELKQYDYIWLVKSSDYEQDIETLVNKLKKLPEITIAHHLPFEKIRNINYLLV